MAEAQQLISAFWQGFSAGISTFVTGPAVIEATLEDGVLYITKAPATLNDEVLEVCSNGGY